MKRILTMVAAMLLASCGQHDPFMSGFTDGSGEYDDPSSSSVEGDGSLLGSCMGTDHGLRACVEILYLNNWDSSVAQQSCAENAGAWSAGSVCPAWYVDLDYSLDGGGIIYYYADPVQFPDDAVLLAAGELTAGSIAELDGEAWYKFAASAGVSYSFSWNDIYSGVAFGDMADVVVDVYNGDGDLIFHGDDEGIVALESDGWVYVRVVRISREGGDGFSVVYIGDGGEMPSSSSGEDPSSSSSEEEIDE